MAILKDAMPLKGQQRMVFCIDMFFKSSARGGAKVIFCTVISAASEPTTMPKTS